MIGVNILKGGRTLSPGKNSCPKFVQLNTQDATKCVVTLYANLLICMEALTAVQVALLTIYDMCKAADRGMTITDVRLLEKQGGKSGHWVAENKAI